MKKKTFILLASLLAACAVLTTASFAVTEQNWFRAEPGTGFTTLSASAAADTAADTTDPAPVPTAADAADTPDVADAAQIAPLSRQWSFRSDNGTFLNLICTVQAVDSPTAAGMYDLTYTLELEHYSLWMSPKTGFVTLGGETQPFTAPAVAEASNTLHRMTLATGSLTVSPGTTLDLDAEMPFLGTYSGKPLDKVVLSGRITLD